MISTPPALTLALGLLFACPLSGSPAPRADVQQQADSAPAPAVVSSPTVEETYLTVTRGEDLLDLLIPRNETLTFEARLGLGVIEAEVGTVTLSSRVVPYRASLLGGGGGESGGETGSITARATGGYTVYELDSTLETRFQPTAWPAMIHRMTQAGTEKRRRETLVGTDAGKPRTTYRSDTRHGAPSGTRIWRPAEEVDAPVGVVDSLGGVFLVRTMLREGVDSVEVPVLDKDRVWNVTISLGESETIETGAGVFQARPVLLETTRRDVQESDDEEFSGPFGIKGDIRLWVEESTGVPVVIAGTLPAGPLEIDLDIRLTSFEGCPEGFAGPGGLPIEAAADSVEETPEPDAD